MATPRLHPIRFARRTIPLDRIVARGDGTGGSSRGAGVRLLACCVYRRRPPWAPGSRSRAAPTPVRGSTAGK